MKDVKVLSLEKQLRAKTQVWWEGVLFLRVLCMVAGGRLLGMKSADHVHKAHTKGQVELNYEIHIEGVLRNKT